MEFEQIRKLVLVAVASDDELCDLLVLKGGNALDLIYKLDNRASLDVDFSMADDVADLAAFEARLTRAIIDRFDAAGFVVFDTTLSRRPMPRPSRIVPPWWGGYAFEFKLITRDVFKEFQGDLNRLRQRATNVSRSMQKTFEVQISRGEYCGDSRKVEVDGYELRVYSLPMIVCEKLRAICQQMPEYVMSGARAARARDFYDIAVLVDDGDVDLLDGQNPDLLRVVFEAKKVPLELLLRIDNERETHRPDWPRVLNAVRGRVETYDYYVDRVLALVERLKAAGIVQAP